MLFGKIQIGQKSVSIDAELVTVGEVRSFDKEGHLTRVVTCVMKDEAGEEFEASVWNNDIDKLKLGTKFRFEGCMCNDFGGKKQITTGKFGRLRCLDETL